MMMTQGLLRWSSCTHSTPFLIPLNNYTPKFAISACLAEQNQQLTARERRQLRNERREEKLGYSWREEVEEKLIKKPTKRYASWTEELNLDTLADSGQQWWVVRVSRLRGQETAEVLARVLARNFPDRVFTVYAPAVQVKRILKNGSLSVKPKPIFPGCVFLKCVMNREIHDFIKEVPGVGGFVGSKVGNTKRQINKPRPVDDVDMDAIFKQAKEEQEKFNQDFENEQKQEKALESEKPVGSKTDDISDIIESAIDSKPKRKPRKPTSTDASGSAGTKTKKKLSAGSTVRVVSGTFTDFVGSLKKMNRKTGKAMVGFTLFGKESLVEFDANELVPETV